MKDTRFLELHQRRITRRIARRSEVVNRQVEKAVGPLMREHPIAGLAAGAATGLALGAALAPRSGSTRGKRGAVSGALGLVGRTAEYAIRAKLVESLSEDEPEKE